MNDKTNNKWCVYKHTNLNNGKIYIGKTCRKPEYRWNLGKGYIAQPYFWNAIKKYGWENFSHEIIKTDLSADEATTLEKELICYHDSMNPEKGYNQTAGGEGMLGWKHTAESKRKIIESNKRRVISDLTKKKQSESHKGIYVGEKNPFYNKKHSAETKLKISIANKGKTHPVSEETRRKISISHMGIGHPISEETKRKISIANKGHVVSEETRKQISNRLSGKNNPMYGKISPTAKKLVQYDLLGTKIAEYNSATEALKITGISNTSIGECCKGKLNSAGGFVWRYENDEFNKFTTPQSFINNNRAIIQYDLQGNFIKRYSSITEIASVFGLNKYSILKVCKTKKGITLNSFWRFEGDDLPSAYKKCIKTRGILQYSKEGVFVAFYESASLAAKSLNCTSTCIIDCCKGRTKTAKGFLFFYSDIFSEKLLNKAIANHKRKSKKVLQFDTEGRFIAEFRCAKDAAKAIGVSETMIYYCCEDKCMTARNYIFKYKEKYAK